MMREFKDDAHKLFMRSFGVHEVPHMLELSKPTEKNREVWNHSNGMHSLMLHNRHHWMGGVNESELQSLLTQGWAEGARKALQLADRFKGSLPVATDIKRHQVWGDQGDDLDRDRLLSGHLDTAWRRTTRVPRAASKIVTVSLPWVHSASFSGEQLFWGGAAALALTDVLEDAGYGVELIAVNSIKPRSGDWTSVTLVSVKAAGEPLRPDAVAGMFCHAGTYRYYGITSTGGVPTRVDPGWGKIVPNSMACELMLEAGRIDQMPHAIFQGIYSEAAAVQAIKVAIENLNGAAVV